MSKIDRRSFLKCGGAAAGSLLAAAGRGEAAPARRPNLVMIMADDMGYSDLGCYGGELETPELDRLAARGLRFTQHHTENMCVPTRSSLMTGLYNTQALRNSTIRPDRPTIAELLLKAGYSTGMSGKWHLAKQEDRANLPCQRGFQQFYGTIHGAGSFYTPSSLMRNNESAEEDFLGNKDFYYTDAISDHSVQYIERSSRAGNPFFLYVAYTAAHWPLHAPEKDIARFKGKYSGGWDKLRESRHARMKELGVVNPAWKLSPRHPDVPAWDDEPHKEWQQRRMEVYAAQVYRMDAGIGRIVKALEKAGQLENTLIAFQIDNGACHVEYSADRKGEFLSDKTRDGRPWRVGNLPSVMPGPEDTFQSYGYGWANAGNTPFRLFKQYNHEGGVRTPLIVHWPAVIRDGGRLTSELSHVIDLAPTFLDAASVPKPPTNMEGKSLLPVFRGEQREGHQALYWKWSHGRAVRRGKWKLVSVDEKPWELYDLEADGTELNNLSAKFPKKTQDLKADWESWNARTAVPGYKRGRKG